MIILILIVLTLKRRGINGLDPQQGSWIWGKGILTLVPNEEN